MSTHSKLEVSVGAFVLAGLAVLAYLSISLGGVQIFGGERYSVTARFASVAGLSENASVRLAGVKVGEVSKIELVDYEAEVTLEVDSNLRLPEDTIASIRTEGLLGAAYVSLTPGGADSHLVAGGRVLQTEPSIDLIELLAKYIFEDGDEDDPLLDPLE